MVTRRSSAARATVFPPATSDSAPRFAPRAGGKKLSRPRRRATGVMPHRKRMPSRPRSATAPSPSARTGTLDAHGRPLNGVQRARTVAR